MLLLSVKILYVESTCIFISLLFIEAIGCSLLSFSFAIFPEAVTGLNQLYCQCPVKTDKAVSTYCSDSL